MFLAPLPTAEVDIISAVHNGRGRLETEVIITLGDEFDREKDDSNIEESINNVWERASMKGTTMHDYQMFRYHSIFTDNKFVELKLGMTSYKEYFATNCLAKEDVETLRKRGDEKHGSGQSYFSDPLGVGVLLLTQDMKFIFLRRPVDHPEAPGMWDRPNCYPDPERLPPAATLQGCQTKDFLAKMAVHEFFDSAARAAVEELNILKGAFYDIEFLGVGMNITKARRPVAEFFMRVNFSSDAIRRSFDRHRHHNATEIIFLGELETRLLPERNNDIYKWTSPGTKGAVLLYIDRHISTFDHANETQASAPTAPTEESTVKAEDQAESEAEVENQTFAEAVVEAMVEAEMEAKSDVEEVTPTKSSEAVPPETDAN